MIPTATLQTSAKKWEELLPFVDDPADRAFLAALAAIPPDIWEPHAKNLPQQMAYESKADIIGFGGAAGGGKTDLGLGLALNKHKRIAIYREDTKQLGGIIDRLTEILGGRDGYDGRGTWRNAGPRAVQIEFGSLQHLGDEQKAQGRARDLVVLEEAPNMIEFCCRFVMGWNRSVDQQMHCQVLMTFNPPTTNEGRWILAYFAPWIDKDYKGIRALPGELRYFATIPGKDGKPKDFEVPDKRPFVMNGNERQYDFDPADYQGEKQTEIIRPKSRTFIPSRVTDNPYLIGTDYVSTLQALPEPLRSQMLKGDFMAGVKEDPWQVIPTAWVEAAMARWKPKDVKPEMMSQGIDVARGGDDKTVIIPRHEGLWFDEPQAYPGKETPDGPSVAALVIAANRDNAVEHIDVIGVGASPFDFLNQHHQQVVGVNVAEVAPGTDRSGRLLFSNLRSWMAWRARELLDPKANNGIAIYPSEQLKKDLCAYKWSVTGSKIYVESREEIIKRLGRSPDYASAFFLSLMETPKILDVVGMREQSNGPYNPYDNLPR